MRVARPDELGLDLCTEEVVLLRVPMGHLQALQIPAGLGRDHEILLPGTHRDGLLELQLSLLPQGR